MKKFICILSALAVLLSAFCISLTASADSVQYRLQFTEKLLTYDETASAWVKSPGDSVGYNYPGYSYIFNDGSAAIRKFVAPEAGELILWNWGLGAYVDNSSGLFSGATFEFAIADADGDIIYPTNGDVATVTEGTPLNEKVEFGNVAVGDTFYFIAMNPSVNQLPVVLHYDFRINGGTVFTDSGRLYGDNAQGTNGWYHCYADSVTKVDPATLVPKAYALDFETAEMTWSDTYAAWSADGTSSALIYPDATYGTTDNSFVAIRKFVMPEDGDIRLAWGAGLTTSSGTAKFAITDEKGKIIYPADGGYVKVTTTAHVIDTTLSGLKKDDAVYLVTWDYSDAGAKVNIHTAFNVNNVSYAYNGCYPYGDNNAQGTNGWYQCYATSITEVAAEDFRDLSELNTEIAAAEAITDLSGYTTDSAAAFTTALATAKTITKANTQTEINNAVAALKAAVAGLTLKPTVPEKIPVAFEFTEKLMTWDSQNNCWTAGAGTGSTTIAAYSTLNSDNSYLAIRKFVVPESGVVRLAWGLGAGVGNGNAKFAIADKNKRIIYPTSGGAANFSSSAAHTFDIEIDDAEAGDVLYFIIYDASVDGTTAWVHTAVNVNNVAYADNGNLWSNANTQGDNGWYYVYAENFTPMAAEDYKNLDELNLLITAGEALSNDLLAKCTEESVNTLKAALTKAKTYSNSNTQGEIDAMSVELKAAINGLRVKPTPDSVKSLSFTEKLMTYDDNNLYWTAPTDPSCIIGPAINIPTTFRNGNKAVIRKLVVPKDGELQLKWGTGVSIDNTSGRFTGATAEFVIADKNGNILYPKNGGTVKITEGTPHELDFTIKDVARGDSIYFITLNPSKDSLPVIYNFGVAIANQALQNDAGNLYGIGGAQGAKNWYYLYADDLAFSNNQVGGEENNGGNENNNNTGNGGNVPVTGDHRSNLPIILLVISAAVCLLIIKTNGLSLDKQER